jgi:hypothetical protein
MGSRTILMAGSLPVIAGSCGLLLQISFALVSIVSLYCNR